MIFLGKGGKLKDRQCPNVTWYGPCKDKGEEGRKDNLREWLGLEVTSGGV